jgi:hypothetical protein
MRTARTATCHSKWISASALALVLGFSLSATAPSTQAEELNLKETPETTSVIVSPFSFGGTVGGLVALNEDLRNENETFLKLGVAASALFAQHFAMGLEYAFILPGSQGGSLTLDYLIGEGSFRPFVGANLGLHYIDAGLPFGESFGISGGAQVGVIFDVLDELQLRVRVPFTMVGNQNGDQLAGVDFSLLFSSPHRKTKVKKLNY